MKKRPKRRQKIPTQAIVIALLALIGLALLLFYHLGSLTPGLSSGEASAAVSPVGWHGIYNNSLYLPLKLMRSVVFFLFKNRGAFLTRLPDTIFGGMSIAAFGALIYLWHGRRTALLSTLLFACSAWTLHVTRLASFDIMYFWATTLALLGYAALQKLPKNTYVWYLNLFLLGLLFTIPGLIWLALLLIYLEKDLLKPRLDKLKKVQEKILSVLLVVIWWPLIIIALLKQHYIKEYLGLPAHFGSIGHIIKNFVAVPVHLFIRGPEASQLWIGKAPLLDAFTLVMCLIGIYYYVRHWQNSRSRFIGATFILSAFLVGLNGDAVFSLLVPFIYLAVAMGLAYLLHAWNKVFPLNPIARGVALGLVIVAVVMSCTYNLREYFVAWPNDPTTYSTFDTTTQNPV